MLVYIERTENFKQAETKLKLIKVNRKLNIWMKFVQRRTLEGQFFLCLYFCSWLLFLQDFAFYHFQLSQPCCPSIEKDKILFLWIRSYLISQISPFRFSHCNFSFISSAACEILGYMHTWNCSICEHTYHSWSVDWDLISTRYPQQQIRSTRWWSAPCLDWCTTCILNSSITKLLTIYKVSGTK